MPSPRVLAACALAASGCSILYDADDLRKVPPDAYQPAIDADPSLLTVTGAEPAELVEGVGADGGRPQLVVIQGSSMINATVTATLDPDGTPVPVEIVEQLV